MNERIDLLALEATDSKGGLDRHKFAELIVRECSQYIEDKFDFFGDEIIIAEAVLKHFGVEE